MYYIIYESLFVARSVSDVKSIQSNRPKPKEQRKNDLTDMAVEDDDVTPMADEEVWIEWVDSLNRPCQL